MKRFDSKKAGEIVDLSYNFAKLLSAEETLTAPVVTVAVEHGTDPAPSAMLSGSPTVEGTMVVQRFIGGISGVTYLLSFQVDVSDGQRFIEQGLLEVE